MPQRKPAGVERLRMQQLQSSTPHASGIEAVVTPTTAGRRGGAATSEHGAGGVPAEALSHRSGNLSSRLTTTLLTARGLISALTTARRRRSTSVTPATAALSPPPKPHEWKLLPSQRSQLSELYHHHHDLARSFWGIYELVHAASISVSPPMLQEALVGVGVPIPDNESDMFLSEQQFLLLVEGIMTDDRHLNTYFEDDHKLVELALLSVPLPREESGSPQQTPSTSALLPSARGTKGDGSPQQHDSLEDSGLGMRVPVASLTRLLMRYNIGCPAPRPQRGGGGSTPSTLGLGSPLRQANNGGGTPPPAFIASVLNELAPSRKPANHRKSIMARNNSIASVCGGDVPDHIPLEFLCNTLNRATISTPDPLTDFRSGGVANSTAALSNPRAANCSKPNAVGAFSVSRPRGLSMQQRNNAVQQSEREGSLMGASPLGCALPGTSPQSSPSVTALVPDASYAFSATAGASQFSLDLNGGASHHQASSACRGHHHLESHSACGSPTTVTAQSPVRHKMISATPVTVPVPPSKHSAAPSPLKRHDSLDTLVRATLQQCTDATNVVLQSAAYAAAARGRGRGRGGPKRGGQQLPKQGKHRVMSGSDDDDEDNGERDSDRDEDSDSASLESPADGDINFGAFRFGGSSSAAFTSPEPSGVFQRGGTVVYTAGLPPLAAVRRSLPQEHRGSRPSEDAPEHLPNLQACASPAPTKYRKPWLEAVSRHKAPHAADAAPTAADDVGPHHRSMKESHRMPMDVLLREVSALTVDDRRALTPNTRRLVMIARSVTSLGFDEHAHRQRQADTMLTEQRSNDNDGNRYSTNADTAVPPPSGGALGNAATAAHNIGAVSQLPSIERATDVQWARWTSGGTTVTTAGGHASYAQKGRKPKKTQKHPAVSISL